MNFFSLQDETKKKSSSIDFFLSALNTIFNGKTDLEKTRKKQLETIFEKHNFNLKKVVSILENIDINEDISETLNDLTNHLTNTKKVWFELNYVFTTKNVVVETIKSIMNDIEMKIFIYAFELLYRDVSTIKLKKEEIKIPYADIIDADSNMKIHDSISTVVDNMEIELSKVGMRNILLIGKAGTGKTEAIYELERRIKKDKVGPRLQNKYICSLSASTLFAGTSNRGDLEGKIEKIMEKLKVEKGRVLLYIDEAHVMFMPGGSSAASPAELFKPYLTNEDICMIWSTTISEYNKYFRKDKALIRRFSLVYVNEPNFDETVEIIKSYNKELRKSYYDLGIIKDIKEENIKMIVEYTNRFSLNQANPAKSIELLKYIYSYSTKLSEDRYISSNEITQCVEKTYNIKLEKNSLQTLKANMKKQIKGQEEAINKIYKYLEEIELGLYYKNRPLKVLIFAGPTGVGKTQTAKLIAKYYFGSETSFIKINMGEYGDNSSSNLLGSSLGYVDSEYGSPIKNHMDMYPHSVVLFDEIEKADAKIYSVLLNIFCEGQMDDVYGNHVNFTNSLIIMTTNLGGLSQDKREIEVAISQHFNRPEFVGRINDIIYFKPLDKKSIYDIACNCIEELASMNPKINQLKYTKNEVLEFLSSELIDKYGARSIQTQIANFIYEKIKELDK